MTPEQIRERARVAGELLAHDLFAQAVRDVEADLYRAWNATQPLDVAGREAIYASRRGVNAVLNKLQSYVNSEAIAKAAKR